MAVSGYTTHYTLRPLVFFCVLNISACVDVSMLTARKEGGVVEWIVVSAVRRYSICNEMGATGSGQMADGVVCRALITAHYL